MATLPTNVTTARTRTEHVADHNELHRLHNALDTAAVKAGDSAGGVLSGTFPNPGFAQDMATQTELDAVKSALVHNVKDSGATGDGVTNDTAAFNVVMSGGNKVIYVPAGTYMIDEINVPAGTHLIGAGRDFTTLKARAGTVHMLDVDGVSNVVIEGLTLDNDRATATTAVAAIRLNGATNVHIRNCRITRSRTTAIGYAGTNTRIFIERNVIDDPQFSGIHNTDTNYQLTTHTLVESQITGNHVTKAGGSVETGYGIGVCGSKTLVADNIVISSTVRSFVNGIVLFGNTVDCMVRGNVSRRHKDDGLTLVACQRVTVQGNTFTESQDTSGIFVIDDTPGRQQNRHITILGNNLNGNYLASIRFGGLFDSSIKGNSCSLNTRFGIYAVGSVAGNVSKFVSIEGNSISTNGEAGLLLGEGSNYNIASNLVRNNGTNAAAAGSRSGIYLQGVADSLVSGNLCTDDQGTSATQASGIELVSAATRNQIVGNFCQGNRQLGIMVNTATHSLIQGNKVADNSQQGAGSFDGIQLVNSAEYNAVIGNQVRRGPGNRQNRGIAIQSNNCFVIANDVHDSGASRIRDLATGTVRYNNPGDDRVRATATWDPASVATGATTSTTIAVTDAALGDVVAVSFSNAVPAGALLMGQVTAAGTVTVTLLNNTGGALDLASGTLLAIVEKRAA